MNTKATGSPIVTKKGPFGGSTNRENSEPYAKVNEIEITNDFSNDRKNPLNEHGWRIWKNHENKLVAVPEGTDTKSNRQRSYIFEFDAGKLYLVEKPNSRYAYFRTNKFQAFIDKFNITKVSRKDPNGEYIGRSGSYKNNVDVCSIVTDKAANVAYLKTPSTPAGEAIVSIKYGTSCFVVDNAKFVIFEQKTTKDHYDEDNVLQNREVVFHLRHLVTNVEIFDIEDEIAEAIREQEGEASIF